MNNTHRAGLLVLVASAVLATLGCVDEKGINGYSSANDFRPGIRTVAVSIWTRGQDVYRRENEMRLTKAIVTRIEVDSPYKVTTRDRADTLLTGSIDLIQQSPLSFDPDTGNVRDLQLIYTVSFKWEDLRTGEVYVKKDTVRFANTYIPTAPYSEDFYTGSEALHDMIARRVVETMESGWGEEK